MYLYLAPHVPDEKYATSLAFLSVPKTQTYQFYIQNQTQGMYNIFYICLSIFTEI